MLSEGYDLLRNLDETGFDIPMDLRGDVKKPGKNPGYWVGLGDDGLPQIVEELRRQGWIGNGAHATRAKTGAPSCQ